MTTPFPPPYPATPQGPYMPGNAGDSLRGATIGQAAQRFFSKYAVFSGRASRSEFWWWALISLIVGAVFSVLRQSSGFFGVLDIVWALATLIPGWALGARRLHDTGKSGWWQLLVLTCVGIILLIVWWAMPPSQAGDKYNNA